MLVLGAEPPLWKRDRWLQERIARLPPAAFAPDRWIASRLWKEVRGCYLNGLYLAAVVLGSAAAERWLRILAGLPDENQTKFPSLVDSQQGEIGDANLVRNLKFAHHYARNVVAHAKDALSLGFLGLERDKEDAGAWSAPDDGLGPLRFSSTSGGTFVGEEFPTGLTFSDAAELVIDNYVELVRATTRPRGTFEV